MSDNRNVRIYFNKIKISFALLKTLLLSIFYYAVISAYEKMFWEVR